MPGEEEAGLWVFVQHYTLEGLKVKLHDLDVGRAVEGIRGDGRHGCDVSLSLCEGELAPLLAESAAGDQLAGNTAASLSQ